MNLIGRGYETKLIKSAADNMKLAQLGIVYGRRRIGKSTLLKSFIKNSEDLYFEGLEGESTEIQISHFARQLAKQLSMPEFKFSSWEEAFDYLSTLFKDGKRFVVFDEFPWMAANRDELVGRLKFYWDRDWSKNKKLTLVLCGSVASYMVNHVLHSKALHNRKTFEIKLEALSAKEAKQFFPKRLNDFEIAKYLMIFGGVPKYLGQINMHRSLMQNVDQMCFQKSGFFVNEFETLFNEQFKTYKIYESIVEKLSIQPYSKEQLLKQLKLPPGGGSLQYLKNLVNADFLLGTYSLDLKYPDRTKIKTRHYYLWDEWLKFYFTFMKSSLSVIQKNVKHGLFEKITVKKLDNYFGLAFERLCRKNILSLVEACELEWSDVVNSAPYFQQASKKPGNKKVLGSQIDLLIVRRDRVVMIFEFKFTQNPVGKGVIAEMEKKINSISIPRGYTFEKILVSASGVTEEVLAEDYFDRVLGLEAVLG